MPKERVNSSSRNDWADLMIGWSKDQHDEPGVEVSFASLNLPGRSGTFWFQPDAPESFGDAEGGHWGPVVVHLDRSQINRMIRTLRRARDDAYGADA